MFDLQNHQNETIVDNKANKTNTVLSSFENKEEEYKQFLTTIEEDKEIRFVKGILYVFLANESKEIVEEGISLYNKFIETVRKREEIDSKLKRYAIKLISSWNQKYKTNVSSVRFCSSETLNQNILVSDKKSYSIKVNDLLEMKEEIGEVFDEVFNIDETYIVKKEELCKKLLFDLVIKTFGEQGIKYFFDIKQSIKVKNPQQLEEVLSSDKFSNDLKKRLNNACLKSNPSITY